MLSGVCVSLVACLIFQQEPIQTVYSIKYCAVLNSVLRAGCCIVEDKR